jgi:hypothetical protein
MEHLLSSLSFCQYHKYVLESILQKVDRFSILAFSLWDLFLCHHNVRFSKNSLGHNELLYQIIILPPCDKKIRKEQQRIHILVRFLIFPPNADPFNSDRILTQCSSFLAWVLNVQEQLRSLCLYLRMICFLLHHCTY